MNQFRLRFTLLVLAGLVFSGCSKTQTGGTNVLKTAIPYMDVLDETFEVLHNDIPMTVRVKRLKSTAATPSNTLLLLPSATYATAPNWDLQFEDNSLMDYFAKSGWVVFALDLPGYGKSGDPPSPESFGAVESVPYIDAAIVHIANEYKIDSVNLLGWSWGAQAAGRYANEHPERVARLVLYGFTYKSGMDASARIEAPFRKVDFEGAKTDFIDGCSEPGVAEAYAVAVVAADSEVPSGPINDYAGRLPLVDPLKLPMPVLVISGEYEVKQPRRMEGDHKAFFDAHKKDLDEFSELLPDGKRALKIIPGGGHAIHLESPREAWRKTVRTFLEYDDKLITAPGE